MMKLLNAAALTAALTAPAAWAQATAPDAADPSKSLLLNLPIFFGLLALFYFAFIRPQKAQQQKHADFIQKLGRGDEVVTSSGIIGKVVGIAERVVTLEVAPGTELKILKSQVQAHLKDATG